MLFSYEKKKKFAFSHINRSDTNSSYDRCLKVNICFYKKRYVWSGCFSASPSGNLTKIKICFDGNHLLNPSEAVCQIHSILLYKILSLSQGIFIAFFYLFVIHLIYIYNNSNYIRANRICPVIMGREY